MPASVYHVYSNAVPDGTATSVVRPSDWNSSHAITLAPSGAEIIGAFSNGGNVSFGTNPSGYVTASALAGGGGVAISAGTNSTSTGTVVFADSNGVSFGMNSLGVVTATAATNYIPLSYSGNLAGTGFTSTTTAGSQLVGTVGTNGVSLGVPAWVTAAGAGDGNNVVGVNGNATQASTTYIFSNGNNVTFGLNAGTITASASYAAQTVDTNKAGTGFTSTTTAGTAVVGTLNTNGLSIGVPTIITNALTTAAQSNHSHGNPTLALTNINGTTASASNGLTLSLSAVVPAQTVQPVAYSAANGSANFSTLTFANSNGVSFSTGTQGLYATVKTDYQSSNANYLTSQSNQAYSAANGSATFQTLTFANSNGVSFSTGTQGIYATVATNYQSQGAYLTTARASNDAVGLNTAVSNATATINSSGFSFDGRGYAGTGTSATNASITLNSNGLAISVAAGGGGADGYNSAQFTNSTANSTMPLLWAGNSNGSGNVTIGLTGSTITMSAPSGGGAGDGYNIIGVNGGATQLSTTYQFSNGNNVTFGLNAGTITASASYPSQTVQPVAISGSNGSFAFSTVTFGSSNGMHFYSTNGSIVGSYTVPTQTVDTNKAGTGFTSTTTAGTAVVGTLNTNGLSMGVPAFITTYANDLTSGRAGTGFTSTTTAGTAVVGTLNTNGLSIGVPTIITNALTTAAQSNHSHNFATTTNNGSQIVVATTNSNGVTIAVPPFITTAAAGNIVIAGSNGALTNTSFQFGNLNGLSFYTSNGSIVGSYTDAGAGAGISAVVISAGTTNNAVSNFSFSNANGVSFGIDGSTITASAAGGGGAAETMTNWVPFQLGNNTTYSSLGQNTVYFQHFIPDQYVTMSKIEMYARGSFVSSTNSQVYAQTIKYGMYSQETGTNSTRMTQMGSSSIAYSVSYNSTTAVGFTISQGAGSFTSTTNNTTALTSISGPFHFYLPYEGSLVPDVKYAFGIVISSATTGNTGAHRFAPLALSIMASTNMAKMYVSTVIASTRSLVGDRDMGLHVTTSSALPSSYATSQLSQVVSRQRFYLQFEQN
jgi:hypothetical protein